MEPTILVALITGGCAVLGQVIISSANAKTHRAEQAVRDAEVQMRLKAIEERLDTHNNYAEKIGTLTVDIAEIKANIQHLREVRS